MRIVGRLHHLRVVEQLNRQKIMNKTFPTAISIKSIDERNTLYSTIKEKTMATNST
jgi:hypothetical protein